MASMQVNKTRWLVSLAAVLPVVGCGDDAPVVQISQGDLTVEVDPNGPQISVWRGGTQVWTTLRGGAVKAGAPPLAFAAVGVDTAKTEFSFGSFRFTDRVETQRWAAVGIRSAVVSSDGRTIEFGLQADGKAAGTGKVAFVDGAASKPYVQITLDSPDYGRVSLGATCADAEHFVGLGGQSFNVDHRGQTVPLWVQEDGIGKEDLEDDNYAGVWFLSGRRHSTHTPMPMTLSSRGYAAVVDADARTIFALCSERDDVARFETWQPKLQFNLFVGGDTQAVGATTVASGAGMQDALHQMLAWVGKPSKASMLMFAPWLDAIFGDANVKRVADRLRTEGIAASAIWTEDFRGGVQGALGYALDEDWRSDAVLYPNIDQLAARLHGQGYAFLTYTNTFLDMEGDVYNEATSSGYAIKDATGAPFMFDGVTFRKTTLLDLSNPAAVTWAKGVLGEMLRDGADGWMADFAEWLPHEAKLASGVDGMLEHNVYPVRWAKFNYEMLGPPANPPRDRLWFMRSAWLHAQPYVQGLWAGDQQTDFNAGDGMQSVIPMGLGLGVTGFPYFTHDIGGYITQGDGIVATTEELYYRWVTFGALTPIMRTHHGREAKSNFQWENNAGSVAHMRRWTRLHMQLVPYLMGSSEAYALTSMPLFRLIALQFPNEPWAWQARDQYLLGDRLLVAPVMTAGATSRTVQLPKGIWWPLLGGPAVTAGTAPALVQAARTEIPVFVPAGAMLVLFPDGVDTVLPAPAAPGVKTAASVGDDRDVWLWAGEASGPTGNAGQWHDEQGPASATPQWKWSGRAAVAGRPTTATFKGAPVTITFDGNDAVINLVGDGDLVFAGGGTLSIQRGHAAAKVTVRLRG
jgi:alpha-glucosidase